ncbi:Hsp20/alpha crystallin family protein [Paenibacillus sp. 32O-W]|uniref:Hsp20/alpha crystallin family protein n=1 Tax=Paenibacillus sp. 32O-W TaxID=1695218 RepID=UPI0011A69EA4|nr:Hsp20/alpha crystallin family protein [Paenibacillus sp. 32O-W]
MESFFKEPLELQKLLDQLTKGQFPFSSEQGTASLFPDSNWIQNYVQSLLKERIPEAVPAQWNPQPEVFETHRSVFVRFELPEEIDPYMLKIRVYPASLQMEGWGEREYKVKLPALVSANRSKAVMKDGIVEIRMPKTSRKGKGKELYLNLY